MGWFGWAMAHWFRRGDSQLVAPDDCLHGVAGLHAVRGRDDELRGDERAAAELEEAALWWFVCDWGWCGVV